MSLLTRTLSLSLSFAFWTSWISWTKSRPDLDNYVFQMNLSWVMKLPSLSWPVRWESSLLIFVGLICNYAMRLNISIAIIKVVEMPLKSIRLFLDEWEHKHSNVAFAKLFSNILGPWGSSFDPGCFLLRLCRLPGCSCWWRSINKAQVPGGRMAEMYGTKKVLGYRFGSKHVNGYICFPRNTTM